MYRLLIYYPDTKRAHVTLTMPRSADVLSRIPELFAEHEGCEHVVLMCNETRIFAVDSEGTRVP
jgi:hypothetical protein